MRKLCVYSVILVLLLASCNFSGIKVGDDPSIDSIQIIRYDRVESRYLTTGDFAALQEMNTSYPTMTRALIENLLELGEVNNINISKALLNYYQDPTLQDVIYASESEFADMNDVLDDLRTGFGNLKREIPHLPIPVFYAQIGAFRQSIIVDDNAIGIALEKYLGKDYSHYKRFYDDSQRRLMVRDMIAPDCMTFYLLSHYVLPQDVHSQKAFDLHVGIVMWVTNKLFGRKAFTTPYVDRVEGYVEKNKDLSIEQLLNTTDFSRF